MHQEWLFYQYLEAFKGKRLIDPETGEIGTIIKFDYDFRTLSVFAKVSFESSITRYIKLNGLKRMINVYRVHNRAKNRI